MIRRAAVVALGLGFVACGRAASNVAKDEAAAERAYAAGRYTEAAEHWREAAARANQPSERDEASYREGAARQRAGDLLGALAVFDRLIAASPASSRTPRAAYDRIAVLFDLGRDEDGYRALDAYVRGYPDSGLAATALKRYVSFVASTRGETAARAYLAELTPKISRTPFDEFVEYQTARSFERDGQLGAARDAYLGVAARHPYPRGVLWDDALFHAAELDERLGDPRSAISLLEGMLAHDEPAYFNGSYERGRYAEAAMRVAELYRDALGDRPRARAAFERVFSEHPTWLRRAEAEWNAALLAAAAGDRSGACSDLAALVSASPDSRYAPCVNRICPSLKPPPGGGACHDYLVRGNE